MESKLGIYFTDFFDVSPIVLEDYGAFNISLVNDLPLFVDPFLLFNSEKAEYQVLHEEIIRYMRFLKQEAAARTLSANLVEAWFKFPEVRQNWLGFCENGNRGHGLGRGFADSLHRGLNSVFHNFGEETVTRGSHIEKLCLVRGGVGRDNISDFTVNLIQHFLAEYTEVFAKEHVADRYRARCAVRKATFNYETRTWTTRHYDLPYINGDYVLLTPKDILTKDETWINRTELLDQLPEIANSLPDSDLRAQVNEYLRFILMDLGNAKQTEIREAMGNIVERFPFIVDYYVREKEEEGEEAASVAHDHVQEVEARFVQAVRELATRLLGPSGFYRLSGSTYHEARERLLFFKDVIENKGGHRLFYFDGRPIERETDLHILYRLTWFGTPFDVSREVNDGRGPADFKISLGASDKSLVEFKLAKNSHLEKNLRKQTAIYEAASDTTNPSLKAIVYFKDVELYRVQSILDRLGLQDSPHVILIDARADNKPSGSKAA